MLPQNRNTMRDIPEQPDQNIFLFFREETEKWENVGRERWEWVAEYSDGNSIRQFDPDTGIYHQFKEIDRGKLARFKMISNTTGKVFDLMYEPDTMKLIHYYSNYITEHLCNEKGQILTPKAHQKLPEDQRYMRRVKTKIYVFGYEKNIGGQTDNHLMMILPDDRLVITDNPEITLMY